MIQCKDCEFYSSTPNGRRVFTCNPFETIKESECLMKWQLMRLDMLLSTQEALFRNNAKLAPLQDKLIRYVEKEIDDLDDADSWKYGDDGDPDDSDDDYADDDEGYDDFDDFDYRK